jgi:tRNA dimethylallyltransferase
MTDVDTHNWQEVISSFLKIAKEPLITILGPTASGKTSFSLAVADFLHESLGKSVEVVNADSRQLYKELTIGTAKITENERKGIDHHLIDTLDPKEEVTVAWYKEQAEKCIDEILQRGHVPLLVGGSMLYLSSVIDGFSFAPESDPITRSRLEKEYDSDDGVTLFDRLKELDPETACSIHRRNKPYVIRAMEILDTTEDIPSQVKSRSVPRYDQLLLGITLPRTELYDRINSRTRQMFSSGWVDEVRGLIASGYKEDDPAMKSCGYREIMRWIREGEKDEDILLDDISTKTRHYAKRQMTWWRNDERTVWFSGLPVRSSDLSSVALAKVEGA